MIEHLTDVEIYEVAAGEAASALVTEHALACAECAGEIDAVRRLLDNVERLEGAVATPIPLERRLARRLDALPASRHSPSILPAVRGLRWLTGAAAAVLCFAAGAVSHAAWSSAGTATNADAGLTTELPRSLAVQRAGTSYVAAIADLATDSGRLSRSDLRTGREVALSAMSGAAFELRRLTAGDPVVDELHQLVERARREAAVGIEP